MFDAAMKLRLVDLNYNFECDLSFETNHDQIVVFMINKVISRSGAK